ncbi:helix-turn-helix transcriptional regulator [Novosphingobium sp. FKTRR1]|uniref:helix-turn-helix domain-containing protein n=1 Tax=Novosphingobium sp. FKTRR1 TaxID=2879118 RepID=UPI001CF015DE|nr:helix-turn-helix transcriptional regulator [Novosphingobium sp. FKTRR1]
MSDSSSNHPLKKWRLGKGLTLDAAAAMVGTTRPVWYNWEKGRRRPGANFMARLRDVTGLSADIFYPDTERNAA